MADGNNTGSSTSKKVSTPNSKPSFWRYNNLQHCVTTKTQSRHLCLLGVCTCSEYKTAVYNYHFFFWKLHRYGTKIALKSQLVYTSDLESRDKSPINRNKNRMCKRALTTWNWGTTGSLAWNYSCWVLGHEIRTLSSNKEPGLIPKEMSVASSLTRSTPFNLRCWSIGITEKLFIS